MNRWLRSHGSGFARTGLALALAALAIGLSQTGWLSRWDWLLYDWSLSVQSRTPAKDIVIVAIDEQSLRNLGRWPWSRQIHAELIRKLTAAGAKGVALDIVFAEPDLINPAADDDLASALADYGRAVLPVLNEQTRLNSPLIETLPIPILAKAAAQLGHVDVELDPDNIARSAYLKAGLGAPRWPTLALALLKVVDPSAEQTLPGRRASAIHAKSSSAWQRDYQILIPFAGPAGHFQQVSYYDVLRGAVPATTFHDKWVLVGVTAAGLGDVLPTPVSAQAQPMSGVEFNANILDALLRGVTIQPLSRTSALLLTGLLVLLFWGIYAIYPPRWTLLLAGSMLLLTCAISFGLLQAGRLWFPPMAVLVVQGISCPLWIGWRWREAKHALLAEQERTQATLYSIDDAVIVTDKQGCVESLNPRAESLLGCAQTAVQGQPLRAIFRLAHDPEYQSPLDLVTLCLQQN
ncbi:MAG: CHASE2 domain-containing protein, partial [Candidatus Competibacteraceae bacterium]|nr:CHASE2 domain-containing protein [Candidatus Competibacteraceae bacterium]